jgi:tetratricopeptide (TPR) repeat protein
MAATDPTSQRGPISQARLDELWDFNQPALSERRFADAIGTATDETQRAELLTQQARALALQGRYDEASAVLDAIASTEPAVQVRRLLERGRVLNSSGHPADAVPLFAEAADRAREAGLTFLAIDALHMVAIAHPAASERYTSQGLDLVNSADDSRTRRWAVALHNNRGWALHDEGRYDEALVQFEAAHGASLEVGTAAQELFARWAIARCLRSLGRYPEALAMQLRLAREDPTDEYVTEEIRALREALGPSPV